MPQRKLTDAERRRLTIAALSRAPLSSVSDLAEAYGVSRSHVYKLKAEALRDVEEEGAFWDQVRKMARGEAGNGGMG